MKPWVGKYYKYGFLGYNDQGNEGRQDLSGGMKKGYCGLRKIL